MKKVLILIIICIGSWIGWWLGSHIGVMTAYLLSVVGASFGLYLGHKILSNYME